MSEIKVQLNNHFATLRNGRWTSTNAQVETLLNSTLPSSVKFHRDPDLRAAIIAVRETGAEFTELDLNTTLDTEQFLEWLDDAVNIDDVVFGELDQDDFYSDVYFGAAKKGFRALKNANWGAKKGQVIAGGLGRGEGGKFVSIKNLPKADQIAAITSQVKAAK